MSRIRERIMRNTYFNIKRWSSGLVILEKKSKNNSKEVGELYPPQNIYSNIDVLHNLYVLNHL